MKIDTVLSGCVNRKNNPGISADTGVIFFFACVACINGVYFSQPRQPPLAEASRCSALKIPPLVSGGFLITIKE